MSHEAVFTDLKPLGILLSEPYVLVKRQTGPFIAYYIKSVASYLFFVNNIYIYQSIGIELMSAIFYLKSINIGSVAKNWYWCITNKDTIIYMLIVVNTR